MQTGALGDGTYTVVVTVWNVSGGGRTVETSAFGSSEVVVRGGGVDLGPVEGGSAAAFRSAVAAVRCAVAIQEAQDGPSRLALGLQAGELPAANVSGAVAVVQAARLAWLANPGQVLVSGLVRQ